MAARYAIARCWRPAMADSMSRWDAFGSWNPVSRPSTTLTPRSGVITRSVQPRMATTRPCSSAADSSARTTVVPTAITGWPVSRAALTASATADGTTNGSSYGRSWASRLATPVWSVRVVKPIPDSARRPSTSGLNARPADGISAEPGSRAYTVWYMLSGHGCVTYG